MCGLGLTGLGFRIFFKLRGLYRDHIEQYDMGSKENTRSLDCSSHEFVRNTSWCLVRLPRGREVREGKIDFRKVSTEGSLTQVHSWAVQA